ncbi:MAG: hypothetical protein R2700_04435 [Solirubrobacterales bacterium]
MVTEIAAGITSAGASTVCSAVEAAFDDASASSGLAVSDASSSAASGQGRPRRATVQRYPMHEFSLSGAAPVAANTLVRMDELSAETTKPRRRWRSTDGSPTSAAGRRALRRWRSSGSSSARRGTREKQLQALRRSIRVSSVAGRKPCR